MSLLRYGAIMPPMRLTEREGYPTGYLSPWYEWTEVGERPLYFEGHWNGSAVVPLEQWEFEQRTWVPTDLSGLLGWWDATAITGLSDGASVSSWADSSGNNHPATQSTAEKRPVYKTSGINGYPAIEFSSDFLTTDITGVTSEVSIFVVSHATSSATYMQAVGGSVCLGTHEGARNIKLPGADDGNAGDNPTAYPTIPAVVSGRYSDTTDVYALRTNGGAVSVGTTVATPPSGTLGIGDQSDGPLNPFPGRIGEVVVYSRSLSDAETTQVESYLMTKWGIA